MSDIVDAYAGAAGGSVMMTEAAAAATPAGDRGTRCGWRVGAVALVFPLVVWGFATLALGGDLGKFLDDYSSSFRDPVTLGYRFPPPFWEVWPYFWRPVHLFVVCSIQTLFWNHDWVRHVISALAHGGAAFAIWALLRRLGIGRRAASGAGLLFLVYPLHYEVVFWPAALSVSLGLALVAFICRWWMTPSGRGVAARAAMLLPLGFLVPCLYEQPATMLGALPLLSLAPVRPGEPVRARLGRAVGALVGGGIACAVYLALFLGTAPARARGSRAGLTSLDVLPDRIAGAVAGVRSGLWGVRAHHVFLGGLEHGWHSMRAVAGVAWMGALIVGAAVWFARWWWPANDATLEIDAQAGAPRRSFVFLFGLAAFVLAWVPGLAVKGNILEPRQFYVPLAGLAVALAAALDGVGAAAWRSGVGRFTVGAGTIALCVCILWGSICLVGMQHVFRERYRLDMRIVTQLQSLASEPPKDAVFVPLETLERPSRTGFALVDNGLPGAMGASWSARAVLQFAYRREDIEATAMNTWLPLPFDGFTEAGMRCRQPIGRRARLPEGGTALTWDEIIPFVVDAKGGVRLVSKLTIARADGTEIHPRLSVVEAMLTKAGREGVRRVLREDPGRGARLLSETVQGRGR